MRNIIAEFQAHEQTLDENQRLVEVAQVLTQGIVRICGRMRTSAPFSETADTQNLSENPQDSLEVPDRTVLSVHKG
jgi:hypothetical protein